MKHDALSTELLSLERKLKILIKEHTQLKADLAATQQENQRLQTHMTDFQNQLKMSKIAGSMSVRERNSAGLKEVIDDYIREIDTCITRLGESGY